MVENQNRCGGRISPRRLALKCSSELPRCFTNGRCSLGSTGKLWRDKYNFHNGPPSSLERERGGGERGAVLGVCVGGGEAGGGGGEAGNIR